MMIRTSILFVVAVTVAHAELSEEAARTLRSLSALPHLTMEFNWSATIESTRCPDFFVGTNELARQVIALRRELIQSPGDPERFLQLGQFLDTLDRDQEAKEAYANAARLFEPRAQASPRDGQLQARFAEALRESGKPEEAEQILHAAVRTTPGVWHCWVGLGESLDSKGSKAIGGGLATGKAGLSTPKLLTEIGRWHPTEGQRNEAEAAWKEADNCFDKAVSLASQDAEAYLARASHRLRTLVKRRLIVRLRKKEKLTQNDKIKDVAAVMVSAEVCEDMAEAARLCPTNYVAVAWEGFAEFFLATASGDSSDRKLLDQIPAVRRKALLDTMQRLEKLADHPNLRVASGALETLGTIRLVSDPDLAGARAAFRRAFTLDRSRRQAWDIWIGLMADTEDWKAMVTACEERLQFEDDAPIRLVMAKACDRADLPEKAMLHAREAVRLNPEDLRTRLCLGALLLRRSADPKAAAESQVQLGHATRLLEKTEGTKERAGLGSTLGLNIAILRALNRQEQEARELLRTVEQIDDEDTRKRLLQIKAALGN